MFTSTVGKNILRGIRGQFCICISMHSLSVIISWCVVLFFWSFFLGFSFYYSQCKIDREGGGDVGMTCSKGPLVVIKPWAAAALYPGLIFYQMSYAAP